MQLKWDQGLASRGKLKGKKNFVAEDEIIKESRFASLINVRWATEAEDENPRKRRKRSSQDRCFASTIPVSQAHGPSATSPSDSSALTPASRYPRIPHLPHSPSSPVPKILFTGHNARLFQHYLNHVAKVTVVTDTDKNPFKTIIMPMSFESPLIMSNILAIAAANIANTFPEYGLIAYSHLSTAYAELKQRLANPETALSEITLAGVLGQVSYQLHHGDVAHWRVHLTAARGIVNALGGPKALLNTNPRYKFYIQHLAWLDVLASTTSSTRQIGGAEYWEALLGAIKVEKSEYGMKDLMGCPEEILEILAQMTRRFDDVFLPAEINLDEDFVEKIVELVDDKDPEKTAKDQEIWAQLAREFHSKLDALAPAIPPSNAETALSEIFRISAQIYLIYRVLHSRCWSTTLQDLLRTALALLELIPPKSAQEMALPWPLFIMGSICVYAREQKLVRARYAVMTKYMGFGNIHKCIEFLEQHVWADWREAEQRSCPSRIAGRPWDERELGRKRWEDVMVEKGFDLLLA